MANHMPHCIYWPITGSPGHIQLQCQRNTCSVLCQINIAILINYYLSTIYITRHTNPSHRNLLLVDKNTFYRAILQVDIFWSYLNILKKGNPQITKVMTSRRIPAAAGNGFMSINCASPLGNRRAGAFTPSPITRFDVVSTFCDKEKMWCTGMWKDN